MAEPVALTNTSFWGFVREHRFVVIHFWAAWNDYDAKMKSLLEHLPEEIGNLIAIGAIDTDPPEHWELCRNQKVLNIPFLAFYRDGELVRSLIGIRPDDVLHKILKELIGGQATC